MKLDFSVTVCCLAAATAIVYKATKASAALLDDASTTFKENTVKSVEAARYASMLHFVVFVKSVVVHEYANIAWTVAFVKNVEHLECCYKVDFRLNRYGISAAFFVVSFLAALSRGLWSVTITTVAIVIDALR